MESPSPGRILFVLLLSGFLACNLFTVGQAQGIQQSPYSAPSMLRGWSSGGLDLAPSNPLGMPGSSAAGAGGSGLLCLSDGMFRGILPLIPNLQFGYLYDFGNNRVSQGRFTADYLLPFSVNGDSMIFGEAHTEFQNFWKTTSFNNRVDMSFGGGYRTLVKHDTLLGVNGFYDTSRLGGTWYSSGGVGFEMAALIGSDAVDLNFNWYGQIFNTTVISNAFRYGPSNFDVQAGYSHELWNGGPDLRLKMTGYKFDVGNGGYGWNTGAELKSRDGVFVLRYDVGHDNINQTYQTLGGFVNVGFQLENVLKGESPFTMPEPIFKSPRSLRYLLTQPVKRDWHQPSSVLVVKAGQASQQAGLTLVATGILGVFSETWNSAGQGAADAFTGGAITAAQLVGVTKITVTITVTSNTSNQPFDIGVYDSAFNFYLSGSIPIGAGATGTFTVDLPPAVVTALITSGNNVLGGLIFAAIPPSTGTATTFSGTVMFYK